MAAIPTLTPADLQLYSRRRQNLRSQFALGQAQNQYDTGLAKQDYARTQRDLRQQFAQRRARLPGSMIQRGVFNSGIHQRALSDFARSRTQAYGDAAQRHAGQMGQLALNRKGLETQLQMGLQEIEAERLARQAELAAQIKALLG